jgi:hypothetical protein
MQPSFIAATASFLVNCQAATAAGPDCASADSWPARSALVHLKNARLTEPNRLDASKTEIVRLASEEVGKDRYRQIHSITLTEKTGKKIEVVTSNIASSEECSISGVQVYVVSKRLGAE